MNQLYQPSDHYNQFIIYGHSNLVPPFNTYLFLCHFFYNPCDTITRWNNPLVNYHFRQKNKWLLINKLSTLVGIFRLLDTSADFIADPLPRSNLPLSTLYIVSGFHKVYCKWHIIITAGTYSRWTHIQSR